jgi:hypothetical protein
MYVDAALASDAMHPPLMAAGPRDERVEGYRAST